MPIIIKNYTWWQSQDIVIIRIPIKGVDSKSSDIFTSDNYLKVSLI